MKNRIIAALLTLMMLFSLLPVTALGTEAGELRPIPEAHSIYINPLCTDDRCFLDITPELGASAEEDDPEYLTEETDVISQIRANYKNRVTTFDIYYRTTDVLSIQDLQAMSDAAVDHTGKPTEGDYLRWNRGSVSYSFGGFTDGTTNYYHFTLNVNYHTSAAQEALVDEAVAQLRTELTLDHLSGYQSLKAVYNWLCDNVTYDHGEDPSTYPLRHSAYGALISKHCVCQGYALTIYRLLLEEGIDCRLISGDSNGDSQTDHGWNIAKLEGKYYNLDATWDAGLSEHAHFLVSQDNFPNHYRDPEFDTAQFHAAYPMAESNYIHEPDIEEEHPGGSNLHWQLDDEGILTISGSGEMTLDTWSSEPEKIKYVIIEEGITSICDDAFSQLYNMAGISIADSVVSIGDGAFEGCAGLKYISIPQGVTEIGSSAFSGCTGLQEVHIGESVRSIEPLAFSNCLALKNIWFRGDAPSFGDNVFHLDRITAHYPAENPTWTSGVFQDYGGTVTWKPNSCINGHTPVIDPEVPSSCTEAGLSQGQHCSACGEVLVPQESLPLADHSPTVDPAVEPTCTKPGYFEGRHCSVCSEVLLAQVEIPELGHLWLLPWTVVTEATETTPGVESRRCMRCEETETREIPATGSAVSFTDVPGLAYYSQPVRWAVAKGITNGTSETTFSPEDPCTRGQIVTFLWRAAGCPVPGNMSNPFVDVTVNDYYYDAVLWAVSAGITNGLSATTFGPSEACTRGQVATFLWRAQGKPEADAARIPFLDVDADAYYATAVRWAVEQGVTTGTSPVTFSPDLPCTRGQIVTFLYRAMA